MVWDQVKLPSGQHVYAFNAHLPNPPNQAYQLLGLQRWLPDLSKNSHRRRGDCRGKKARGKYIDRLLKLVKSFVDTEDPIFVVGDFNEPSHLDWTESRGQSGPPPHESGFPHIPEDG